jgi:hypothetical protein
MVNSYPETPGIYPDTLDFVSGHSEPGVSRLTRDTLKNIIQISFCGSQVFVWVLLSTSSKSKTCSSKSLLIVRYSCTQKIKQKSTLREISTTAFSFSFEESYFIICFACSTLVPAHMLDIEIKRICVLSSKHQNPLRGLDIFQKGTLGKKSINADDHASLSKAHSTVLQQLALVAPYIFSPGT